MNTSIRLKLATIVLSLTTFMGYGQDAGSWLQSYSDLPRGQSVVVSGNGQIVAVGDPFAQTINNNGKVVLYRKSSNGFEKFAQITGTTDDEEFGGQMAMNESGTRLIIAGYVKSDRSLSGAPIRGGGVSMYELNPSDSTYSQLGQKLSGSDIDSGYGISVDMTKGGDTIAIGEFQYQIETYESNEGRAQVYYYDGTRWTRVGSDIIGDRQGILLGSAVSLSANGQRLAIGIKNGGFNFSGGAAAVYDLLDGAWAQVGSTLVEETNAKFFGSSIDLSKDGSVLAVGTGTRQLRLDNPYNSNTGFFARAFEFNGSDWQQKGSTLTSDKTDDVFGYHVVLNDAGDRMAVAAPWYNLDNSTENGLVNVYEYNTTSSDWAVLSESILPNEDNKYYGFGLDMNSDGTSVFITSPFNNAGKVESFDLVTSLPAPEVPTPPDNRTITDMPIIFSWLNEYPEETEALIQLSLSSDFSELIYADTIRSVEKLLPLETELSYTHADTLTLEDSIYAGNTYFWRISTRTTEDVSTSFTSDWTEGSFDVAPIDPPIFYSTDGVTYEPPFNLVWSDEPDPDHFQVNFHLSTQPDFSDTVELELNAVDSIYAVGMTDTLAQGTYYWRVRRQLTAATDRTSDWISQSFTIEVPGTTPDLPADGAAIELPATIEWSSLSADDINYKFELQISTSMNFADTLVDEKNLSDSTFIEDFDFQRTIGETYYWRTRRVSPINKTYASKWSSPISFSTKIDAPVITGPIGETVELPYTFTWEEDTLDAYYDYQLTLYNDVNLSEPIEVFNIQNGTTHQVNPGDASLQIRPNTTYYWDMKRYANQNADLTSTASASGSFTVEVNNAVISSPTMAEVVNPANYRHQWSQTGLENQADYSYALTISSNPDLSVADDIIYNYTGIQGNFHRLSSILDADTSQVYYWGIRRYANGNDFLMSDYVMDSLRYQIEEPVLTGPADGTDITTGPASVQLSWLLTPGITIQYHIQISEFEDFSNPMVDELITSNTYSPANLETNETYYWRVKSVWTQGSIEDYYMSSRWSSASFFIYPDYIRLIADSVFAYEPSYVNVMLHALDEEGEGITVLENDDFDLLENNSPISPTESRYQISKLGRIPSNLQTVLMLDNSLSIGEDNLDSIKQAAKRFIVNKSENQEIALYVFADQVEQVMDYSTDTIALMNAVDNITLTQFSGTDLYSATITGLNAMENKFSLTEIQQSFMLLFTDGKDLAGRATLDSVLSVRGNKQIYAVGVKLNETDFDEPTLSQIGNAATFVDDGFDQLVSRFNEVQKNSIQFSEAFYWLNYSSTRRAGDTDLTVRMNQNTNANADAEIVASFNADGFYSSPIAIVVDGSAEVPLGVDTLRMAGDDTVSVKIESLFGFIPHPFSFEVSEPSKLRVAPELEEAFQFTFTANGVEDDTITVVIRDTVQQTLNLEKTLTLIYSERTSAVNEPPQIADQSFSIDENSPESTLVGTAVATDAEGDALEFAITAGNDLGGFAIGILSGELTIADASVIDYETNPSFTLTVSVSDAFATSSAQVQITLNDLDDGSTNTAPEITAQSFTVEENSPIGTTVGTIVATDADNDELTFSITDGNTLGAFAVDERNGLITVASRSALDFETTPKFNLTVEVSDGQATASATMTITLNDVDEAGNTPPTITAQPFSIDENAASGTSIGTVNASDADGDALTFAIVGGNELGGFAIDPSSGVLSVATASVLDYEVNPSFLLTVEVSDGIVAASATITINLNDLDDNSAPEVTAQSFSIDENSAGGSNIGTVIATDADDDPLAFHITAGNTAGLFEIMGSTGVINLTSTGSLDYEDNALYTLTVEVSDGTLSASAQMTINVNDINEAPEIPNQSFDVDENSGNGVFVGTVTASDPDGDGITFAIISGDGADAFEIDNSGVLTVADGSLLDYETNTSLSLTVEASDGDLTASATVTIAINDVEEAVISSVKELEYTVYPNPATNVIHIQSSNTFAGTIEVVTLSGLVIGTMEVQHLSEFTFNISNIAGGVYFLRLTNELDGSVKLQRVVKK